MSVVLCSECDVGALCSECYLGCVMSVVLCRLCKVMNNPQCHILSHVEIFIRILENFHYLSRFGYIIYGI